ncbi:MAG: VOC family protein [Actinomycetota bacterium]
MAFHPYLYFNGDCREAFTRYQELFGGELMILDGTQAPPGEIPEDKLDMVMHAALTTEDGALLMASDVYEQYAPPAGMYVHYSTTDLDRGRAIFEGLSDGADVTSPGQEMFWTPFYGALTDRWGTRWQVSVEQTEA